MSRWKAGALVSAFTFVVAGVGAGFVPVEYTVEGRPHGVTSTLGYTTIEDRDTYLGPITVFQNIGNRSIGYKTNPEKHLQRELVLRENPDSFLRVQYRGTLLTPVNPLNLLDRGRGYPRYKATSVDIVNPP